MKRARGNPLHIACIVAALAMAMTMTASGAQRESPGDGGTAVGTNAVVEQPRPFGYVIGDIVAQRIPLRANGQEFEPAALPGAQRLGAWLERRAAGIESSPDGRRWLVVEYQIINAPQSLTTVTLPAWELDTKDSNRLSIDEWPISVAALTPRTSFDRGGLMDLRPDRAAPVIATRPIRRQVWLWSTAFAVTLVSWFAWGLWRNWRAASSQPFARALREMREVDETTPDAWQALHRAFDATAGRVVQTQTLPVLFERAPHLQPLSPMIERFFAQSAERFFGAGLSAEPVSVRALCGALRRAEKRRER